jgi:hypothetical protein
MSQSKFEVFRSGKLPLLIIMAAFLAWGGWYIWNTSFPINGTRYFCLFDDAMISMRYAQTFAHGNGLVWYPGTERVEGFTNPLWTLLMTAVHLPGLPQNLTSLCIQLMGLALLAMNLACVYKISRRLSDNSTLCAIATTFLTAFYLPLNTWGLQGMEVSLVTLLINASILLILKRIDTPKSLWGVFALLGMAVLTRPDGVIPYVAVLVFMAVFANPDRLRRLFLGFTFLAGLLLGVTLLRCLYYHDLLPNTYYLKMTGFPALLRISRGWHMLANTIEATGPGFVAAMVVYTSLHVRRKEIFLLGSILAAQAAYSVYVGGDAWEWFGPSYPNRYLCVAMPGFFILFTLAAKWLLIDSFPVLSLGLSSFTRVLRQLAFVMLVGLAWLSFHGANTPRGMNRFLKNMRVERGTPLHVIDNSHNVLAAIWLRETCPPDTMVAVRWAGASPYFSGFPTIDMLGKCDRRIARMTVPATDWRDYYPGHTKFDLSFSMDQLRPEVVLPYNWTAPYQGYVKVGSIDKLILYVRQDRTDLVQAIKTRSAASAAAYLNLCSYWHRTPRTTQR